MAGVKGRSGGARKGTGPKPFQPTAADRTIVEMGAALGLPADKIALRITDPKTKEPISVRVLQKNFQLELDRGLSSAIYQVGVALIQNAKKGNVEAQKFFLKARAKWSENLNVTVRRPDEMSDDELDAAIAAAAAAVGNEPAAEDPDLAALVGTGEGATRH